VTMKRSGIELGKQINAPEAGVDAVGDRDIDEAIFAGKWDGGFGAFFGQRKEARALAAAHDYRKDGTGIGRLPACI
jgi:hypothetical protein